MGSYVVVKLIIVLAKKNAWSFIGDGLETNQMKWKQIKEISEKLGLTINIEMGFNVFFFLVVKFNLNVGKMTV